MPKVYKTRSCGKKHRHYSRRIAQIHMFKLINKGIGGDLRTLMVYHCSYCKHFHVGHVK